MNQRIEQALAANGFTLVPQRKHCVYKNADGRNFVLPSTPSDRRGWLTFLADLKFESFGPAERLNRIGVLLALEIEKLNQHPQG